MSVRSASSSRLASASLDVVRVPTPVPTSSARWWTTPRSTSVAVSRRRCRPSRRLGALIGDARRVDVDVEDVDDRAAEADRVAELDGEVAAGHVHGDPVADQAASVRDRGRRARAGAARQRLADAALPDAHRERVGSPGVGRDELDVGAVREARVVLEARTVLGDAGVVGVVDEEHEVRVAHPAASPR